jgi:hypothetical protein
MLSENAPLGYSDDALHELDELLDRWENRLTVDNLALAERYLKGEIRLIVSFEKIGRADKQFRAVLQGVLPIARVDGERKNRYLLGLPFDRQPEVQPNVFIGGPYRYDRLVFVQSVKLVDHPKGFAPSLVWFETVNESFADRAHSLYFSRSVGFEFLHTAADWKACPGSDLPTVSQNQLANQLIQSRTQIVHNVADRGAQAGWHVFDDVNPVDVAARLRVLVSDDAVWVALDEGPDVSFKLTDVAFGPFDLDQRTGQGAGSGR